MRTSKYVIFCLISAVAVMLAACGKQESATYDDVNFTEETDLFSQPVRQPQPAVNPATPLAVVNSHTVTVNDVEMEIRSLFAASRQRMTPEQLQQERPRLIQLALRNLIRRQLLLDESYRVQPDSIESAIDEAISNIVSNLPPEQSLADILEARNMTQDDLRSNLEKELRISQLVDSYMEEADIPGEEEVTAFYEENRERFQAPESVSARHILLTITGEDDEASIEQKRLQIEALRDELLAGADFADIAREHSACPSAQRGGNLGSFARGQMVPAFEEAAFGQDVGEIGPVIRTRYGFHIIKVEEKNPAREVPYVEVKTNILERLTRMARQQAVEEKLNELNEKADVEMLNQPSAAPAGP